MKNLLKISRNYTKTLLISKSEKENNNAKNAEEKNDNYDNKEIKM